MSADPVRAWNNEHDEQSQRNNALGETVREKSDAILDSMNIFDVIESLEYLEYADEVRLTRAIADGDSIEIGDLILKCAKVYADAVAERKAEKSE